MKKSYKKFISVIIATFMALSLIVSGRGSLSTVNAASVPEKQDSASAVNYKTVLGGAVDYGIVADSITQYSHMETTFATKTFIREVQPFNPNNDVDYIDSTGLFLIGALADDSNGNKTVIALGKCTAETLYMEAPSAVFGSTFNPSQAAASSTQNGNIEFRGDYGDSRLISNINPDASVNVERMIKRIKEQHPEDAPKGWSLFLQERANDNKYVLNPNTAPEGEPKDQHTGVPYFSVDSGNAHFYVDLTDDAFKNKVVYIDVDSYILKFIQDNGKFHVEKDPSTVVVINIDNDVLNTTTETLTLHHSVVKVNGVDYTGDTPINGGDWDKAKAVQENYNNTVIWNIMAENPVTLSASGGAVLIPNSNNVKIGDGNASGWLVTGGHVDIWNEFHFLYRSASKDGLGQIHFAVNKGFTNSYANKNATVPDTSVDIADGDFEFFWQEYEDNSYSTPYGEQKTAPVDKDGAVLFPVLTFTSDPADSEDHFYVAKNSSEDFYFMITENPAKTVSGISNSNGKIKIKLIVTADDKENFTYNVSYESLTGYEIPYAKFDDIHMSGVQFDLGIFYNKSGPDKYTKFSKQEVGGGELKGATITLTGKSAADTDILFRVADVEVGTEGTLNTTSDSTTLEWISGITPTVIKNLPNGTYTMHEEKVPDESKYVAATDIVFTVADGVVTVTSTGTETLSTDSEGDQVITMFDDLKTQSKTNIKISKVSWRSANNHYNIDVVGAGLKLTANDSTVDFTDLGVTATQNGETAKDLIVNNNSVSFTTIKDYDAVISNLPDGVYTLTEEITPYGYQTANPITLTISEGQ
ncbi:MAG: hypothetical protein J5517_00775, partial [Eubacterium sp.]|nr:hypothetical protein [Eubacterium sp.]